MSKRGVKNKTEHKQHFFVGWKKKTDTELDITSPVNLASVLTYDRIGLMLQ